MDETEDMATRESKSAAYLAAPRIELIFGVPEALDRTDAVTALAILRYMESRPALGKADRIALVAIAALADHDPDTARVLIAELNQ